MIAISNLAIRFGKKILFEGVSGKFNPNSRYGLIGANGVGKSNFIRILAGLQESTEGKVFINKKNRLSYLEQNHYKYDNFTVLETVFMGHKKLWEVYNEREVLYSKEKMNAEEEERCGTIEGEFAELGGYEMDSQAARLLNGLGLEEKFYHSKMSELIGAKKFRTLLAQALFGNPEILLLDEPTNYLDMRTIRWLINFLLQYKGVLIVISHDRFFLNSICTQIVDLDFQSMRFFTGNYDDFLIQNQIILERMRKENDKKERRAEELKNFISRFGANAARARQATTRQKELEKLSIEKMKPSSRIAPYIRFKVEKKLGQKVMEVKNISKAYGETLFSDFSFSIDNDEKVAIIGDNAVGKTSLIKILVGKLQPEQGEVILGDTVEIGYFPQDTMEALNPEMKALDWLANFAHEGKITETDLRSTMGRMLFKGEDSEKKISVLSGGERSRMVIAKLLLEKSNVLVLDEPTNHLDLEAIEALNLALKKFENTVIFVSHDREFVNSLATKIIHINKGKAIIYPGKLDDYEKKAKL